MARTSYLPYPDAVFFNGRVRTFAPGQPIVEAIACSAGRIVAVGSTEEILRLCGSDTRDVNLKGRTLIPGLTRVMGYARRRDEHGE